MKRLAAAITVAFAFLVSGCLALADNTVAEPAGYRMEDYKSPVPATLKGALVVTAEQAAALKQENRTLFFDVMPRILKPEKLPAGTIWRDKVRKDIPGSIWLPNTGYGALSPEAEQYFRIALAAHTAGDKTHPILFYCMTDCWMSWNAAKRAIELGYASVAWFPGGADGWEKNGLPLVQGAPYELP